VLFVFVFKRVRVFFAFTVFFALAAVFAFTATAVVAFALTATATFAATAVFALTATVVCDFNIAVCRNEKDPTQFTFSTNCDSERRAGSFKSKCCARSDAVLLKISMIFS